MDRRGVANIIGIVVLFGLVALSALSLFIVGSSAVGSVQDDATVEQAESAMVAFAEDASSGTAASFEPPAEGSTHVNESSRILVESGSEEVLNTSMGAIVYEHDGEQRVFEGGAVFASSGERTQIVRSPPIQYERAAGAREQTLLVDVVTVRGSVEDIKAGTALERSEHDPAGMDSSVDEPVTVTVQSAYADAWARYFRRQTAANVAYVDGTNTVTATFPVADPLSVENGFTVDGPLELTGGIHVSSYDSTTSSGAGSVGIGNYRETGDTDVVTDGGFRGRGGMTVDGNLYVNDSFTMGHGTSVNGDLYAMGDVELSTDHVNRTIVSGGTITTNRGGIVFNESSELRAAGDFVDHDSSEYAGTVHVDGNIDATGGNTDVLSSAAFMANGSVAISPSPHPSHVTQNGPSPSLQELDRIDAATDDTFDPAERVDRAFDHYGSAPDPGIGGANADDTLTAGTYRLNRDLRYRGDPSLTLDTRGGDIVVLIDGDVGAGGIDADVVGNGQVHIYVTGNFETGGGSSWANPAGAGNRLFVYTADDGEATDINGDDFYGVIFSESELEVNGGISIFGGIVMDGSKFAGGQNIYYDEALREEDITIGNAAGSQPERTHLHVTTTTVEDD